MKKNILFFIMGGIFFSIIAVYATMTYSANQITYTKGNNTMYLSEAIDELYSEADKDILTRLNLSSSKVYVEKSYTGDRQTRSVNLNLSAGKYLIFSTSASTGGGNSSQVSDSTSYGSPTITTTKGSCVSLKGQSTTSVASATIGQTNVGLWYYGKIYVCDIPEAATTTLTTPNLTSNSQCVSSLVAYAVKLD